MKLFFFRKSRFTESIQSLAVFRTRTCQEDYAIFALFQVWSVCLFLTKYYIKCLIILKHGKSVFFFAYSCTQMPSCILSLSFFFHKWWHTHILLQLLFLLYSISWRFFPHKYMKSILILFFLFVLAIWYEIVWTYFSLLN